MAAELKKPATITVWAWTPGTDEAVAMFEKAYPNIKVKLQNVGQGPPHYRKVRTVLKSGKGLPDVIQMEFQYIPSFTLTKSLLDMKPYLPADFMSNYPEWIQKQINVDGGDLRRSVGLRPARPHLPQGPARQGRRQDADQDLGRVRHRGGQVPQGQPEVLPRQPARRPDRPVARALLAERRAAVHDGSEQRQVRPDERPDQAGHGLLGQALPDRLDLARRGLQRRLVPGLRQGQVRGLAVRGLGPDLPAGLHEELQGPVARPGAAAVERGRHRLRQLGRLDARGRSRTARTRRRPRSSPAGSSRSSSRSRCSRSSGSCSRP